MIFEQPQTNVWEWNNINVWSSRTHSGVFLLWYSLSLEEKEKQRESVELLIDNGVKLGLKFTQISYNVHFLINDISETILALASWYSHFVWSFKKSGAFLGLAVFLVFFLAGAAFWRKFHRRKRNKDYLYICLHINPFIYTTNHNCYCTFK